MRNLRYLGLDVHSKSISVAIAEQTGEVRYLGIIPNDPVAVRLLLKKLGKSSNLRACYEAGPCGYTLFWQLTKLGIDCVVVAPTLIPMKAGDRVKTDRRDAEKLARLYRAGELTSVWVPDAQHESLRDLVRVREDVVQDRLRARHRLNKFLLRHGKQRPEVMKSWSVKHRQWLQVLIFEDPVLEIVFRDYLHEVDRIGERLERLENQIDLAINKAPQSIRTVVDVLQALRGVAKITAATLVAEIGSFSRFESPRQLMAYAGVVPREHSSGGSLHRGSITKTGNHHVRRVIGEASFSYQKRPNIGYQLKQRSRDIPEEIKAIAWKAQHRLHNRYLALQMKGKNKQKVITAVSRELLGFIWAIGCKAEAAKEKLAA